MYKSEIYVELQILDQQTNDNASQLLGLTKCTASTVVEHRYFQYYLEQSQKVLVYIHDPSAVEFVKATIHVINNPTSQHQNHPIQFTKQQRHVLSKRTHHLSGWELCLLILLILSIYW
jgi:hypothetical protein